MRYEEFQLTFEPRSEENFAVRLRSRVAGEAEGVLRLPFAEAELPAVFAALAPTNASQPGEPVPVAPMAAEEIGGRLFDVLFADKLGERFAAATEKIEGDPEAGLRLELGFDLERPEIRPLAALPWELLYHRDRRRFLALGAKTPVVRRIFMPRGVRPPLAPPLRLLTAWSDPKGEPLLDIGGESMSIERALADVPGLALSYLADPAVDRLRTALQGNGEGAFQILHWIGHGRIDRRSGEGSLVFSGEERATRLVSGRILADYLQDCDALRLVVLSACEGGRLPGAPGADPFAGVASALALAGVPAVIAMQMPVRDSAAIAFVRALYAQLARGLPLEAAVGEARLAVRAQKPGSAEFAVPVAFLRQGDLSLVEPAAGEGWAAAGVGVRRALSEFRGLIEEKTRDFAGRRWLFERFDSFSQSVESGYFLLRGDPGIGKTAVVAKLAQSRGYARYFNQSQSGNQTPGAFLRSLCAQLIAAYGLARELAPEAGESAQFLTSLLDQISEQMPPGERAVFLVDALDEAALGIHPSGANLLYLPPVLPRGIFALVTAQRGEIPLRAESIEPFDLDATSVQNEEDVREYLERAALRPRVASYLKRRALSAEAFVAELVKKSEGNFIYLHYVLPELEVGGSRHDDEPMDLPNGLLNYYDEHWRRMKAADEDAWYEEKLPVLATLTMAREPMPFDLIGDLAGLPNRRLLSRVLAEWAPFLLKVPPPEGGERLYRLYHSSFRDFVSRKDQVIDEKVRLSLGQMNQRFAGHLLEQHVLPSDFDPVRSKKLDKAPRTPATSPEKLGQPVVLIDTDKSIVGIEHKEVRSPALSVRSEADIWKQSDPDIEDEKPGGLTNFLVDYRLRHLAAHLAGAGDHGGLFHLFEDTDHLRRQAERFQSFERGVIDIVEYALPAAIDEADWGRFLTFATVALHLSGLGEELAEPELLAALARSGRIDLARDAARSLPDPWLRVEALAAVAAGAGLGSSRDAESMLAELRETIESKQLPQSAPERLTALDCIRSAARLAGPEIGERWSIWLSKLTCEEAGAIRRVLAEAWVKRGDPESEGLWRALAATDNDDRPALARLLGGISKGKAHAIRNRLWEAMPSRRIEIEFLAGLALKYPMEASELATETSLSGSDFLDTERVDELRVLLELLPAAAVDILAAEAPSRGARAALAAVALATEPSEVRIAAARVALERLEESTSRLDAALRYLSAYPSSPERLRQLGAVAAWLVEARFAPSLAPAQLVRRFLDLAAFLLPSRAVSLLDEAACAPGIRDDDLLLYARELAAEPLLERLIDQAGDYSSAVSRTALSSFALQAEIRIEAAFNLCARRGDLRGLMRAVPLLGISEMDDLRHRLALRWIPTTQNNDIREQYAREVCDGIEDGRLRLTARIAALPPERFQHDDSDPILLYSALARDSALVGEIDGLAALCDLPLELPEIARSILASYPLHSRASRLLHLAEHSITFEEATYGKDADRGVALGVLRSALAFDSDRSRVAAAPEVAAIGALCAPSSVSLEIEEAAAWMSALVTVPWLERRNSLARLFAAVPRILQRAGGNALSGTDELAQALALLPLTIGPSEVREEIRTGWASLVPILTAAVERVTLTSPRTFSRALEEGFGSLRSNHERAVLELCLSTAAERAQWIDRAISFAAPDLIQIGSDTRPGTLSGTSILRGTTPAPNLELLTTEPATLALLIPLKPELATALASLWPHDEKRDAACILLLRERWLGEDRDAARALAEIATEGAARAEAMGWAALDSPDAEWSQHLANWLVATASAPDEPNFAPLRRRLWCVEPGTSRPVIARRFGDTFRLGGRAAAEAMLRWFLHAHLSPRLGDESPTALGEIQAAKRALSRARHLPSPADHPNVKLGTP